MTEINTPRNPSWLYREFVPLHEREWDSRLFVDRALKGHTEIQLETIARALTGCTKIKVQMCESHTKPFEHTDHIKGDCCNWIQQPNRYLLCAQMGSYIFYGNRMSEIWLKIIQHWICDRQWPCGGADQPNTHSIASENLNES